MKQKFIIALLFAFVVVSSYAQKAVEPFVAGETTIFAADFSNDEIDSMPSQWTLADVGDCTVVEFKGEKVMKIEGEMTQVLPKIVEILPNAFTVEYEVWSDDECPSVPFHNINVEFTDANNDQIVMLYGLNPCVGPDHNELNYEFKKPTGAQGASAVEGKIINPMMKVNSWTKVQVAYNNGTFTYYINGKRAVRPTATKKPSFVRLNGIDNEETGFYVRSFRLAK